MYNVAYLAIGIHWHCCLEPFFFLLFKLYPNAIQLLFQKLVSVDVLSLSCHLDQFVCSLLMKRSIVCGRYTERVSWLTKHWEQWTRVLRTIWPGRDQHMRWQGWMVDRYIDQSEWIDSMARIKTFSSPLMQVAFVSLKPFIESILNKHTNIYTNIETTTMKRNNSQSAMRLQRCPGNSKARQRLAEKWAQ